MRSSGPAPAASAAAQNQGGFPYADPRQSTSIMPVETYLMDPALQEWLRLSQGPLFRMALALMLLGLLRNALLALSDAFGAYTVEPDRAVYWKKFRARLLWHVFPPLVLMRHRPAGDPIGLPYLFVLSSISLLFRLGIVLVPAFMAAHVYLWERGLGVGWPTLPGAVADAGALLTMAAGMALLLGRLYSPFLRRVESAWSFVRPLALLAPMFTGILAMHPQWSPADYYVVMLFHTLSAALAFILVPFAGLLSDMRAPIARVLPELAWRHEEARAPDGARARKAVAA